MEIKILEETKTKLSLECDNATITALLKKELWNDEHVTVSGQKMRHPLIGKPHLHVETDGKIDPRTALKEAIKRSKKEIEKYKKAFK